MSIKRTGGRKPTMGNWRCEYMAQSEYAVCKCCHINGDLHMDARQIYRRFLYPVTRALLATCALGLTPVPDPDTPYAFSSAISERLSHAMQRTGADVQICEYIFHSRRSNARFRVVCTRFPNRSRIWTAELELRGKGRYFVRDFIIYRRTISNIQVIQKNKQNIFNFIII